jgi:hypothetical protein
MILTLALALVHPVVAALLATLPILGVGMISILRVRAAKRGESGYGTLFGMITEKSVANFSKAEIVARLRSLVQRGELPARVLEQVDAGLPTSVLRVLGYTDQQIVKSETDALAQIRIGDDLATAASALLKKGASERTLRQEDLDEPARRPGRRMVQVDATELERLRKVARVVQKFLDAGGGPPRGGILDDDDEN